MGYTYNSITACFGLEEPLTTFQLQRMLERIQSSGCEPTGEPIYNGNIWIEQRLYWDLLNHRWAARLRQTHFQNVDCTTFALDIDARIFLPGNEILYSPSGDPKFLHYRHLLTYLVTDVTVTIGEIDYEADLICSGVKSGYPNTIASWGNYFPMEWINGLDQESRGLLSGVVDETFDANQSGIFTFIHPLQANRAWNTKHQKLDEIIRRHFDF